MQDLNKSQPFGSDQLTSQFNQPIWHMSYMQLQTFGGHIFAWTPFLMCNAWGPLKGWFFGDFIQTWSSGSWELSPNLIFEASGSWQVLPYLNIWSSMSKLLPLTVSELALMGPSRLLCAEILTVRDQGYAWIAFMIFSTRRLHIGQFGEVFQFFLAQG